MDSGDWNYSDEVDEDDCESIINEEKRKCFHKFDEHVKNVKISGEYLKQEGCPNLKQDLSDLKTSDISAFLRIGAEAEKRREEQFTSMMDNLEQVSRNNKLLHNDIHRKNEIIETLEGQITDNNAIICSLKCEINNFKQKYIEAKQINNHFYNFQGEIERFKTENAKLSKEIEQLSWEYMEFQNCHNNCPTSQENQQHINTITHLNNLIAEAKIQIQTGKQEIMYLTESNAVLQEKIKQLTQELKDVCQTQFDKNKCYEDIILQLQNQVKKLNTDVVIAQDELRQREIMHDKLKCLVKNVMHQTNDIQNKKLEELQDVVYKQAMEIKCLEEKNSVTTNKLENDCEALDDIISKQNKQINNMTNEIMCRFDDDAESLGLLSEITQLNYDINKNCKNTCVKTNNCSNLLKRIIKIRSRIVTKLQKEECRFEKSSRDLCLLRCQFAKLQTEIEKYRLSDSNDHKDEIKKRINKEQDLSKSIVKIEKESDFAKLKLLQLQKTLKNIDKMREVVQHINL